MTSSVATDSGVGSCRQGPRAFDENDTKARCHGDLGNKDEVHDIHHRQRAKQNACEFESRPRDQCPSRRGGAVQPHRRCRFKYCHRSVDPPVEIIERTADPVDVATDENQHHHEREGPKYPLQDTHMCVVGAKQRRCSKRTPRATEIREGIRDGRLDVDPVVADSTLIAFEYKSRMESHTDAEKTEEKELSPSDSTDNRGVYYLIRRFGVGVQSAHAITG